MVYDQQHVVPLTKQHNEIVDVLSAKRTQLRALNGIKHYVPRSND